MADKQSLYKAAQDAGHDLPDYDDITGKELEALLSGDSGDHKQAGGGDSLTVHNLRRNPVVVGGHVVAPKGSVKLTERDLQDERLMAKLQHGEATGVFKLG
jgi:hypothetical protein